ncbi:MAG: branched-chain amino acid ABC transporter permease [Alphaproteobacteria bacterium]|nr:branched-chain amino acid ABC transporter permease [Alphaproteobacteria bacterium]
MPRHQRLSIAVGRIVLVGAAAILAGAPFFLGAGDLTVLTEFLCLLVLAWMWNLLAGYADIVTVGQHAFVGVGAYTFYGTVVLLGVDPYLAFAAAALMALVIALPAMMIVFRLRAAYLAVGTWVVAEVLMLIAGKLPNFGFGSGVSLPVRVAREFGARPDERFATIYWLAFALAAATFASTYFLLRSRIGLGLTAMRDNEEAAGAMGINLVRARVICFLWTAPFLGLAGAIITLQKLRISPPASFSIIDWTVFVIFNVVIGGIGSLEGPILGTALFFILREYLAQLGTWHLIILGTLSIVIILIEPRGLWGLLRRVLGGDLIPVSHGARPGFGITRKS